MTKPYRVYKTEKEWQHQVRVLVVFGIICGFIMGAGFISFIFLLSLGMR